MTKIKPNDPCICGSGKKYKKCCGKSFKKRILQFSKEEWEETYNYLLPRLVSYLHKTKFKNDLDKGLNIFFQHQDIEKMELGDDEDLLFTVFMVNCYQYFPSKKSLIELFLDENYFSLLPMERALLKNLSMGQWKVFKTLNPEKKYYNRVQDVFNDKIIQFTTIDKLNLPIGKIYTGLIFQLGEDYYASGLIINIHEEKLGRITSTIMDEFHKVEKAGSNIEFSLFLKHNAHLIIQLSGFNNKLRTRNQDGSPIRFWSIIFQILNRKKLDKSLKNDSMMQLNDQSLTWLLKGKIAEMLDVDEFDLTEPFTIFGIGHIEGDLLIIEVNSTKRMEAAEEYLIENYVEELSHIDSKNLGDIHSYQPQKVSDKTDYSRDQLSKETLRDLEKKYLKDYYYNQWIYNPIPSLGYISPVEALEENPDELDVLLAGINMLPNGIIIDSNDLYKHIVKQAEIERDYMEYKNIQIEMVQIAFIEYLIGKNNIDISDSYKGTIDPYYDYLVLYKDALRIGEVVDEQDSTKIVFFDEGSQKLSPSDFCYRLSEEESDVLDYFYDKQEYQSDFTIKFLRKFKSNVEYTVSVFYYYKILFAIVDFVTLYLEEHDEIITCTLREYSDYFSETRFYPKDKQMDISAKEFFQAMVFPEQFFSFDSDLAGKLKKPKSKFDRLVWYVCWLLAQFEYVNEFQKSFNMHDRNIQLYIHKVYNKNIKRIEDEFNIFIEIKNKDILYNQLKNYISSIISEPLSYTDLLQ